MLRWAGAVSCLEEHHLVIALQVDIQHVLRTARGPLGDQRAAARRFHERQDRIFRIGCPLVGEIKAGKQVREQATRKHRQVQVRRLHDIAPTRTAASRTRRGHAAGLDRGEGIAAIRIRRYAPKARKLRLQNAADGMREPVQVMEGNYQLMPGVCPWWDGVKRERKAG